MLRLVFFFFNDTATTGIYTSLHTLSLHDALPISPTPEPACGRGDRGCASVHDSGRSEEHTSELQSRNDISYAVFCLKKKRSEASPPDEARRARTRDETEDAFGHVRPRVRQLQPRGFLFFFNDAAPTEIYTSLHTLSLHDALPIFRFQIWRQVDVHLVSVPEAS